MPPAAIDAGRAMRFSKGSTLYTRFAVTAHIIPEKTGGSRMENIFILIPAALLYMISDIIKIKT